MGRPEPSVSHGGVFLLALGFDTPVMSFAWHSSNWCMNLGPQREHNQSTCRVSVWVVRRHTCSSASGLRDCQIHHLSLSQPYVVCLDTFSGPKEQLKSTHFPTYRTSRGRRYSARALPGSHFPVNTQQRY
ncbi:hypothetical protein BC834DRAFT_517794 [Gloeopeniophorella convolvens]|nr:hypothetical protein BC834DRAFT_517794 [Gloeopeniophorella convolvens]